MRRLLIAVTALLAAVLLPAAPAWAHNQLVEAAPARDAKLDAGPAEVRLRFSERLNPDFTTIVVSDAARRRVPAGDPAIDGTTGTITLTTPPGDGVYTVAYRTVSVDGHSVQGSYTFTVGDPPPSAAPEASPAPAESGPPVALLAGGAGVLAAGGALFWFLRRRAVRPGGTGN